MQIDQDEAAIDWRRAAAIEPSDDPQPVRRLPAPQKGKCVPASTRVAGATARRWNAGEGMRMSGTSSPQRKIPRGPIRGTLKPQRVSWDCLSGNGTNEAAGSLFASVSGIAGSANSLSSCDDRHRQRPFLFQLCLFIRTLLAAGQDATKRLASFGRTVQADMTNAGTSLNRPSVADILPDASTNAESKDLVERLAEITQPVLRHVLQGIGQSGLRQIVQFGPIQPVELDHVPSDPTGKGEISEEQLVTFLNGHDASTLMEADAIALSGSTGTWYGRHGGTSHQVKPRATDVDASRRPTCRIKTSSIHSVTIPQLSVGASSTGVARVFSFDTIPFICRGIR